MAEIDHKRGATFRLSAQWLENGVGDDLGTDTLSCKMENEKYEYVFSVSPEYEASGEFEIFAPKEDTAMWPIGEYDADIKRTTAAGEVVYTETFVINVISAVA